MKKVKSFRLLSNFEQKLVIGGSSENMRCCNPSTDCCYPTGGNPPQPATIQACGLSGSSSCFFLYSSNGCCI